jgi:hypothetical protein
MRGIDRNKKCPKIRLYAGDIFNVSDKDFASKNVRYGKRIYIYSEFIYFN